MGTVDGDALLPWGELAMPVPGLELASWIEARLGAGRCGAVIPGPS
jgi:hypothetical protein